MHTTAQQAACVWLLYHAHGGGTAAGRTFPSRVGGTQLSRSVWCLHSPWVPHPARLRHPAGLHPPAARLDPGKWTYPAGMSSPLPPFLSSLMLSNGSHGRPRPSLGEERDYCQHALAHLQHLAGTADLLHNGGAALLWMCGSPLPPHFSVQQ